MGEPLIPGGYILLSRRLLDSGIMEKPPLYFKVWLYLLLQAQHGEYNGLQRGELITSIPRIIKAMTYKVGFRVEPPTKWEVWGVLQWLRGDSDDVVHNSANSKPKATMKTTTPDPMKATMIETRKVRHGLLVKVVKYREYQDPQNYESHPESNDEDNAVTDHEGNNEGNDRPNNTINKNVSYKKDQVRSRIFEHWNSKGIVKHRSLDDKTKGTMNGAMKNHSEEEILRAIDNYARILEGDEYYFSYKWTLKDFLGRGLEKFLDWEVASQNYLHDQNKVSKMTKREQGEEPCPIDPKLKELLELVDPPQTCGWSSVAF